MGKSASLANLGAIADTSLNFRNRIINGDMRIDQRNAGAAVTPTNGAYTLDRWKTETSGGGVYTVQQSSTAPAGFNNSALITVTTADASIASTDYYDFQQFIEGFNAADLGWGSASAQSVTLSFWVRSSLTGTFSGSVSNSAANRSYVFSYAISAANTWEQKTVTIPGDTSGTWLTTNGRGIALTFDLGNGATYTQSSAGSWVATYAAGLTSAVKVISTIGATFYITGVQLEAGTVASPFDRRDYGRELMMCQRYYEVLLGTVYGTPGLSGYAGYVNWQFKVTKRATPVITLGAGSSVTSLDTVNVWGAQGYNVTSGAYPNLAGATTANSEL